VGYFRIGYIGFMSYLLVTVLFYLSGMTFGGALEFLFYFMFLFITASGVVFIVHISTFRVIELFSTDHPVKGEDISYTFSVANESIFPLSRLFLMYKKSSLLQGDSFDDETVFLERGGSLKKSRVLRCPCRGIYEVGLDGVEISDITGIFTYSPLLFSRTFYVYPRLIVPERLFFEDRITVSQAGVRSGLSDITEDFKYVDEYRSGDNVKDLCWKRFFVTGKPFVKRYENSSKTVINVYLDLRKIDVINPVAAEDVSIELFLSISKYFLSKNIQLRGRGGGELLLEGSAEGYAFKRFYDSTIYLKFNSPLSPLDDAGYDNFSTVTGGSSIFITHHADYSLLEFLLHSGGAVILNMAGRTPDEYAAFADTARGKGTLCAVVNSSAQIKDALEGQGNLT
jgi:hypothetical protein